MRMKREWRSGDPTHLRRSGYGIKMNFVEWLLNYIIVPTTIFLLVILFIGVPVAFYFGIQDSRKPTFSLKKDEWSCTKVHEYTTQNMIMVGKVMVPQRVTHNDCIQWSKK